MNLYMCVKFDPDRSGSGLDAFPDLSIDDPLTPKASRVSRVNFLAHVHSQINMCAKFGPDRSSCLASFPHVLMSDPIPPSKYPLGIERLIVLVDVHSQIYEYAYVCQMLVPIGPVVCDRTVGDC